MSVVFGDFESGTGRKPFPKLHELRISEEELNNAKLHPTCLVEDLFYADVSVWTAPGGTGKTTLFLKTAMDLILGNRIFGKKNFASGKSVLFITAEDQRNQCIARVRELTNAMNLSDTDKKEVREKLPILDVDGEKIVDIIEGRIYTTDFPDRIIEMCEGCDVSVICIDPMSAFGASERWVNDNEIALIMVGRIISRALKCMMIYIHHTGKANAREKTTDIYSGRGGSSLGDNARMFIAINFWGGKDPRPLQFLHAKPDDDVLYLSFPKISYASKFKNTVWFKRKGWTFEYAIETRRPQEEIDAALADQLERWLTSQLKEGRRYTKTEIENGAIYESFNMKRTEFRKALVMLRAEGRVIDKELPEGEKKGVRNKFLFCPAGCGGND